MGPTISPRHFMFTQPISEGSTHLILGKSSLPHQRMKTKMRSWITLLSCSCCQDSRRVPTTSCPLDKHPLRKRRRVVYQRNLIGTTTTAFNNVTSWIYHTPPPLMHITTPPNCDVHIRAKCTWTIYLDMMELYNLPKKHYRSSNQCDLESNASDNRWTFNLELFVSTPNVLSFQYLYWLKCENTVGGWRQTKGIFWRGLCVDSSIKTANTQLHQNGRYSRGILNSHNTGLNSSSWTEHQEEWKY